MVEGYMEARRGKWTFWVVMAVLVLLVGFVWWVRGLVLDSRARTAVELQERAATTKHIEELAETISKNQKEIRTEILLHRCRKDQLMRLLLKEHGIPVPFDPHPNPCPEILR